jgi:threonine dehydratase
MTRLESAEITIEQLRAARRVGDGFVTVTPVLPSRTLSEAVGASVVLKAECLQRTGSFKIRGALNRISRLTDEERIRGVVAASAGNHAQGVALAASVLGVPATIYVPLGASLTKIEATRSYGATVIRQGEGFDDAYRAGEEHAEREGATFVSAFDDPEVVAGQGTLGLELVEQVPDAEVVIVPCGGGGLLAGVAIALRALRPGVRIVGVQAAGCASFGASLAAGRIVPATTSQTIADGIAVKRPGRITFPIIQRLVDDMVVVSDDEIAAMIALLVERQKLVCEGAGAAGAAALLHGRCGDVAGKRVVVVLSGGNIDLPLVMATIRVGLTEHGRYLTIRTTVPDRPGALARLLTLLAEDRVNVVDVLHHREGRDLFVTDTGIDLTLETRDHAHQGEIVRRLRERGYQVQQLQ